MIQNTTPTSSNRPRNATFGLRALRGRASCAVIALAALATAWPITPGARASAATAQDDQTGSLKRLRIDRDNIVVTESIVIEPGVYRVADTDGNGVLQVRADNITIEFAPGAILIGSEDEDARPDTFLGTGIRVEGADRVAIIRPQIGGFKAGIHASSANNLVIMDGEFRDLWRQRLGSTPSREDSRDWLWPHRNDENEWLNNYGASIYVEDSDEVEIARTVVREGQNGIILDNVRHGRIYDNDASFLSGWGLAMWRSSYNVISRNAFDFCIRGYSHGVYNRGQDSSGIVCFEQCSFNIFAENSATHGGDGFFGFAGREALGELWLEQERARLRQELGREDVESEIEYTDEVLDQFRRRGCNNNLLINNDFSYAAAHGIEMTFSFGNAYYGNRLVGNAICGVWGGYSQETHIAANEMAENGEGAYGLERGGVNIEHGYRNRIEQNTFRDNKCGVHLWWDPDTGLLSLPWAKANHRGSIENLIVNNSFEGDLLAIQLRETKNTTLAGNMMTAVKTELEADDASPIIEGDAPTPDFSVPTDYVVYGETQPVGQRDHLRGRHNIIMHEWGPWDHESPLMRFESGPDGSETEGHQWSLYKGAPVQQVRVTGSDAPAAGDEDGEESGVRIETSAVSEDRTTISVTPPDAPGVYAYALDVICEDGRRFPISGSFINATWDARFFAWTHDPREDYAAWELESRGDKAARATLQRLRLPYGWGGPSDQNISREVTEAELGGDQFGMIARTTIPLGPGTWRVTTLSDDGVRVTVNGQTVIDNWTHHGPTRDTGAFTLSRAEAGPVEIVVEHFELNGYSVLEFAIEEVPPTAETEKNAAN